MKAILLALADGQSLWPIPTGGSPAGIPLLGRPLLAWSARALKRAGVSELVLALPEGASAPRQELLPVTARLLPPGTGAAEALLLCASELKGEDFLAVDGSLLWDLNLTASLAAHKQGGLAATLTAPAPSRPPARSGGRVLPFPENWPDAADTGVLILSPAVFRFLDKKGELIPQLRRAGQLSVLRAEGFCQRLSSPSALLQATAGLLARTPDKEEPQLRPGIRSRSPIPEDVELVPPCSIGAGVTLGKGCLIGPHVWLEDGAAIGDHSLVQRSILQAGVRVGSRATIYGAVICSHAALGSYTVLNEGAVLGPDARIGDNVILMEGVGVGAGLTVPDSLRLTQRLTSAPGAPAAPPSEPELTVEDMLLLGRRLGQCGAVGAGGAGFRGTLLARAFGCGAAAQGAAVVFHDGTLPEQAAWLARYYRWPASVFADEEGGVYLYDPEGRPLTVPPPDGEAGEGSWDLLAGTAAAYSAAREREAEELPPACTAFHHKRSLRFL